MPEVFRCSLASKADDEPLAGTAPPEQAYLFVEYAGAWGAQAVAETRWPTEVRERLASLDGVRVQLIRRYGGISGPGIRVFHARTTPMGTEVRTGVLDRVEQLLDLDLDPDTDTDTDTVVLEPYEHPLWLVCTNGRRDLCCAELGRPVAAALSARWPEETWETTHLGGHRFAVTMLALPSSITLGRLDTESAVLALEEVLAGRHPLGFSRGLAGLSPRAQVAQLHVLEATGLDRLGEVRVLAERDGTVRLQAGEETWEVRVESRPGPDRAQSCGVDPVAKPTTVHEVVHATPVSASTVR